MSPFRCAPHVELGPLDVGLEGAAIRAMQSLPRGGRIVEVRPMPRASHIAGAVGSVGLVAVLTLFFVAWTTRWSAVPPPPGMSYHAPSFATVLTAGAADVLFCVAVVIAGGASLAAVLRASDRAADQVVHSGEVIGRRARRVLERMARLASEAATDPDRFGQRRVAALRRVLAAASDPDLAQWIPEDVRGRAQLLLARSTASLGGPRWEQDPIRRREVRSLLEAAADRLDDGWPAEENLAAIERSPVPERAACRVRVRVTRERDRRRVRVAAAMARVREIEVMSEAEVMSEVELIEDARAEAEGAEVLRQLERS